MREEQPPPQASLRVINPTRLRERLFEHGLMPFPPIFLSLFSCFREKKPFCLCQVVEQTEYGLLKKDSFSLHFCVGFNGEKRWVDRPKSPS